MKQRQAVILAAGRGSRLGSILNGKPKCLLEVDGRPLISYQVEMLRSLGVERICVVVGHGAGYVYESLDDDISFVVNPRYSDTNSLFSLWLAAAWVEGPFTMMNSDLLAHPKIYERVVNSGKTCLAYDSSSGNEEEHMKIQIEDGAVRAIRKSLPIELSAGENVGILNFEEEEAKGVLIEADRLVREGKTSHWSPSAIDGIAHRHRFEAVDVADLSWTEIDFPEDLKFARETVWNEVKRELLNGQCYSKKRHSKTGEIHPKSERQKNILRGGGRPASASIYRIPAWPVA